jgi:hypothetical protein
MKSKKLLLLGLGSLSKLRAVEVKIKSPRSFLIQRTHLVLNQSGMDSLSCEPQKGHGPTYHNGCMRKIGSSSSLNFH